MRVRILGIGTGPRQLTGEAADALRGCDYAVAARKGDDDGLLALRRAVCAAYGVPLVEVPDPVRDRGSGDYKGAVAAWHEARVRAYERVLGERGGTAAFLVWGDPSLYDSTLRIVEAVAARGAVPVEYDVLPGISAPQLLAARHRIVLHGVGDPVHVTPARRLGEAVAAGHRDIVVMLSGRHGFDGLADWSVWWGANLGTETEELVAGRVGDVLPEIEEARLRARGKAGWVMDTALLRRPR
ncbi:precorrin-6A synthase (deacetylating) [Nocardiopsis changdeensis]|uniref:Precorrin-6A synthase (Deacetylating) n=1 Tax=Nocardiopsis changdeensis TaxID=2831969 RepID=A0ABX8BVL1_9ACTN|nr:MULTISPECIES: precorrin-6A synthase (deacetylating) [Nocardiopsis]QUX25244.1 precorrin-6A synthase (deacetylating) [Nocardiopsis changdeensis]QYX35631.1 precorrin-6A synthase (deacetylating) [Nocardiopsis sp. MT53]